jgi:alpha-L-rhamnosidase
MVDHYLALRSDETGLVPQSKHWHISDWPYPDVDHSGKYLAAENIKIFHNVQLMHKMAGILGREEDAQEYATVESEYRRDIRRILLDTQRGLFRDSSNSVHYATGVNALALCYGLFENDEFNQAVSHLEDTPWESSTLLTLNVLQSLFANGRTEAAYRMLTADKERGWGVMIKKGYGTMWEGFSDIESHSHAWNAYPARIFAEYLVGIRCAEPGFTRVELKPCFPADLNHVSATVNTPQGKLSAKWDRSEFGITLNLRVPYGVNVDVYLPAENGTYSFVKTVSAGHHMITM